MPALAFGPLLTIAMMRLVHAWEQHIPRVDARTAGLHGASTGTAVLAMLTVQQALFPTPVRIPDVDPLRTALSYQGCKDR